MPGERVSEQALIAENKREGWKLMVLNESDLNAAAASIVMCSTKFVYSSPASVGNPVFIH